MFTPAAPRLVVLLLIALVLDLVLGLIGLESTRRGLFRWVHDDGRNLHRESVDSPLREVER